MPSCGVRPSVCHVRGFCRNEYTYHQTFSPSGSHTILVFLYQTLWQYSDGDPLTGEKNRDFQPMSGFRIDDCCNVVNISTAFVGISCQ